MESELFLLFAVGLALYFAWSLSRSEDEEADDMEQWQNECDRNNDTGNEDINNDIKAAKKRAIMSTIRIPPYVGDGKSKQTRKQCIANSAKSFKPKGNQYGGDYAELQLVIDNLSMTSVFNPANLPLTSAGRGEKRKVYPHANKLVYKLGRSAGIGLSLIDVCKIHREATETQTRFTFEIVVQRDTPVPCTDMAIILVKMIMDFNQENGPSDKGFFEDYMLTNEPTPKLESVSISKTVGDYTDLQSEAVTQFYAIDGSDSADFANQTEITRIVKDTRKKHDDDVRDLNVLIDENGDDAQDYNPRFPEIANKYNKGAGMGTRTVDQRMREC